LFLQLGIWEFKKLFVAIAAVCLLSSGGTGLSGVAFADKADDDLWEQFSENIETKSIKELKDLLWQIKERVYQEIIEEKNEKHSRTKIINLGILQVAAHDFFNVSRCMDENRELIPGCVVVDNENQKLDLSTVLVKQTSECDLTDCEPFTDMQIANGGEFRNSENVMIFTAASELGEKYLELRDKHGEEKAYNKILKIYHGQLKKAFEGTFHQPWPQSQDGEVGPEHNLALRSVHDLLPGEIYIDGEKVSVFEFLKTNPPEKLSKKDQRQQSAPLDGEFDDAFTPIDFCIVEPSEGNPGFCINVDLEVADIDFAEQFLIDPDFLDHMDETSDGSFDSDENVTQLIIELFARGKVI
jgi:hypothetical protein